MVRRPPHPISGMCISRCFWQAAVTNSCFQPNAIVRIHAPINLRTGRLHRLAADILVSETKSPGVREYLKTSGAGFQLKFTQLTGRDLIKLGAPQCH